MNVYDFDGTIYDGDSSIDFYLFCIKRKPSILFRSIIKQLSGVVLYTFKRITKERYKEKYFSFLKFVSVNNQLLNEFWSANNKKVKDWYLNQKAISDVVISASPEFLLQQICNRLGVSLIASKVDPSTGQFTGKNCHGQEKVKRFIELYPNEKIDEFYTDSKSDYPLAALATKAYMVKKDEITELRFGIKNEEDYN